MIDFVLGAGLLALAYFQLHFLFWPLIALVAIWGLVRFGMWVFW